MSRNPQQYSLADEISRDSSIHCATLAITENLQGLSSAKQLAKPRADLENGTITFVRMNDRIFAITCDHVIKRYRSLLNERENSHSLRTMLGGFYQVADTFKRPYGQYGDTELDIAIGGFSRRHFERLGKIAIDLDRALPTPTGIRHAYAVGFPEKLKTERYIANDVGYQVSMPHVSILAEINNDPDRRFVMRSELVNPAPDISYSGMSGGPIFWSSENEYGLLGIIYEGGLTDGFNTITVYGEYASVEVVRNWITQYDSLK